MFSLVGYPGVEGKEGKEGKERGEREDIELKVNRVREKDKEIY